MPIKLKYFELVNSQPDLFVVPEAGFEILLDPDDIRVAESGYAEKLRSKGNPSDWAEVGVVFEDQYNMILRDAVRFPDDQYGTYFRIINKSGDPCGSAVLPFYNGDIVFLRHYRHAVQKWLIEIPRGAREPGESLEETARNELYEEIGGRASSLVSLGDVHSSSGLTQESFRLYYADLVELGEPNTAEGISEIIRVPVAELSAMISSGELTDALASTTILRARCKGLLPVS